MSVGIFDRLGLGRGNAVVDAAMRIPYTGVFQPSSPLPPFVVSDIFGEDAARNLPIDRDAAISIPAVSKARNLLVSTIAKMPLRALRGDEDVSANHAWLYRTPDLVTPYERMAWTVDDLMFYGNALWLVDRGARDETGRGAIKDVSYCPREWWTLTNGHILVNEIDVAQDEVIFFNSPFEGLLNIGGRTLRGALDQEASWVGRARNPVPLIELHQNDDTLEPEDVKEFVKAWATARTSELGAIGYTPPSIEIRTHGEVKADMAVEGRNAVRTDVGSFLNIRASMLDGTMGIDSLTYTTTEGERNSFYEFDLPFWTDPIAARLSMDDVVPRGQRIRFDMYEALNTPTPTGPTVED